VRLVGGQATDCAQPPSNQGCGCAGGGNVVDWSADDWCKLIDADAWQRDRCPTRDDGRIVIGCHGRDSMWRWPTTAADILASFPDDPCIRVVILGGADVPRRVLKRLPGNWKVHRFGSLSPTEFLAGLDAFVYFPHTDMTEAFGRTIVEAIAVGGAVITDERFVPLFGDSINVATARTSSKVRPQPMSRRRRNVTVTNTPASINHNATKAAVSVPPVLGNVKFRSTT
jgi:hypothetical protein